VKAKDVTKARALRKAKAATEAEARAKAVEEQQALADRLLAPAPCFSCIDAAMASFGSFYAVEELFEDEPPARLPRGVIYVKKESLRHAAEHAARRLCSHTLPPAILSTEAAVAALPRWVFFLSEGREMIRIDDSIAPLKAVASIKADHPWELRLLGLVRKYTLAVIREHFSDLHEHGPWFRFTTGPDSIVSFARKHTDESYSEETEAANLERRLVLAESEAWEALDRLSVYERRLLGVPGYVYDLEESSLENRLLAVQRGIGGESLRGERKSLTLQAAEEGPMPIVRDTKIKVDLLEGIGESGSWKKATKR
jgi:hypothetical protein